VIRTATAFLVPVKVSGRAYLKQCLVRNGIDPRTIPEACIYEFVDFAMKTSSFPVRPSAAEFRARVVKSLETMASIFVLWRHDPRDSMFQGQSSYREIFERYGVK
jgi:hypothetical protein